MVRIDDVSTNDMSIKHLDTTKDIVITPMKEMGGPVQLDTAHTWTAKVSDWANYIGDYPVIIESNSIVVNSSEFTSLPAGIYHLEVWEEWIDSNNEKQRSIYPSPQRTIDFNIYRNITDLAEKEIKTIGFQDVVDQAVTNVWNNMVIKVNTIESDQTATVVQSVADGKNYVTFNIPQGAKGDKGDTGDNNLYLINHLLPLMATKGKTINTNVDYGAKVNTALNDVSSYQVVNQTCQPGDIFIVTNLAGGMNPLGWAFLDKDGQLLHKSLTNAKADLITLYAPSDANNLIVNSSSPDFAVYQYNPDASHLAETNIAEALNVNYNIKLAFQPGETVSLDPENVGGYKYEVLSCKAGDEFKICGVGGLNPRLYGFLTADNHLISAADPNLDASNGIYIKAPYQANKLVVNYAPGNPAELYKVPNGTIKIEQQFNQLATPPVDVRMASYFNGIKLGKDLSTHLADFAKDGDKMVHVSAFYKVADTLYMSYYANTRTAAEDPTQHTARLVYAPFNNLSQQTYIDVADIGQEYDGQTIDAIYDSLLLKTSDDSYMIYAFTAKVGGKFLMLYRHFDPNTKLLSDIHTMGFKVGALSGAFDTVSIYNLLAQIGVNYAYENRDISFIQKLSPRVENGTTQYYAGIGILHFCFIVKSSDLINWTFVTAPDFKYKPEFEPSVYVKGDCVYYFCRQQGTEANAVLAKYDINNNRWSKPILVPDTQSRYDFFEDNNQLYLVHSPLDRNHISLMQIDRNILDKSYEVATAKVQDCFYPFTQNIDGQMYMSFTQSRQHIWLNKFSPTYYSSDEVANLFDKSPVTSAAPAN